MDEENNQIWTWIKT